MQHVVSEDINHQHSNMDVISNVSIAVPQIFCKLEEEKDVIVN
jgi:hypothetical protein